MRYLAALGAAAALCGCVSRPVQDIATADPETVPTEYSSEREDWSEWSKARNDSFRESYGACLKKAGIQLSCGACTSANIKVLIQMDNSGKIGAIRKYKENVCGQPAPPVFEKCLEDFYRSRTFPALKGKLFRATLGTGLSC